MSTEKDRLAHAEFAFPAERKERAAASKYGVHIAEDDWRDLFAGGKKRSAGLAVSQTLALVTRGRRSQGSGRFAAAGLTVPRRRRGTAGQSRFGAPGAA
jgi:hypothetical protein